jgi:hypothetical protein
MKRLKDSLVSSSFISGAIPTLGRYNGMLRFDGRLFIAAVIG